MGMNVPSDPTHGARSDGEASRLRLLHTALRLFAQQGYAKTSIREIAAAAQVNVAAISYYFGDKPSLYRATFLDVLADDPADMARLSHPDLGLREAVHGLLQSYTEPLKAGDLGLLSAQLHMREMVEPTGLCTQEIEQCTRPQHDALVAVLCRHLGLAQATDGVHRLAFSIASLPVFLYVGRDMVQATRPSLIHTPQALDEWTARMTAYALAMVDTERQTMGAEA